MSAPSDCCWMVSMQILSSLTSILFICLIRQGMLTSRRRLLQRRLLLLDTLEHTLVEPCMSTLFNQKASEGLWIC